MYKHQKHAPHFKIDKNKSEYISKHFITQVSYNSDKQVYYNNDTYFIKRKTKKLNLI